MDQLKCGICKEFKNKEEFNKAGKKRGYQSHCRKCQKQKRIDNHNYPEVIEFLKQRRVNYRQRKKDKDENNIDRFIKRRLMSRLKKFKRRKLNQVNNITVEEIKLVYLEQDGLCKLSGVKMALEVGNDDSLSIDRIDSSLGYTRENIQLTCIWANIMKQSMNNKELVERCQLIISN